MTLSTLKILEVTLFSLDSRKAATYLQALDEYLYFLSKTNYFPGNYDLRKAIGHKRWGPCKTCKQTAQQSFCRCVDIV